MFEMSRTFPAAVLAVLLAGQLTFATVTVPTEFREIVSEATLIVRGHITEVRPVVAPGRGVESIGTIGVDSVLKGQAGDFISIRVPGGVVGRYRWVMVAAPSLRAGDQGVFFVKHDRENAWRPVGLAMGIYRIQVAPVTGLPVVEPPLVAGETAATGLVIRGDPKRHLMAVREFESLVRVVIASQSVQRQRINR